MYRKNAKLQELLRINKEKGRVDVRQFDFEETPDAWREAVDFLHQPSLFASTEKSKTLVIRNNASVDEKGEKIWAKILKEYAALSQPILILTDGKKPKKLFDFLLRDPVKSYEYGELLGVRLEAFIKKEAETRGVQFTPEALKLFLHYLEAHPDSTWRGIQEVEKLSCAKLAMPLSLMSLRSSLSWNSREEVFQMARELMNEKGKGRKIKILEMMLLQKEAPGYLFNSLAYQVRGSDAVRFAEYDLRVKSGNAEYEEVLLEFVLS
jgi:DNA polymerase III delta subunit